MVNHPSLGVEFLGIGENARVSIFGIRLQGANSPGGDLVPVDLSTFWRSSSLFGHWNGRVDSQSFFDYSIEIREFVNWSKFRHTGVVILDSFEFGSKFVLNVLKSRSRDLPEDVSECFSGRISADPSVIFFFVRTYPAKK